MAISIDFPQNESIFSNQIKLYMPYAVVKTQKGFGVKNTETGRFISQNTTKEKAEAQLRLLEGLKHKTLEPKK